MVNIRSFRDMILESDSPDRLWAVCYTGEENPDFFGLYRTKREAVYAKSMSDLAQLVDEYRWAHENGRYDGSFKDYIETYQGIDDVYGLDIEEIDIRDESKHEQYILRAMSEPSYTGAKEGAPTQSGADMVRLLIDSGVNPPRGMRDPKKLIDRIEQDEKLGRDVSWATPDMMTKMRRASKTRGTFGV